MYHHTSLHSTGPGLWLLGISPHFPNISVLASASALPRIILENPTRVLLPLWNFSKKDVVERGYLWSFLNSIKNVILVFHFPYQLPCDLPPCKCKLSLPRYSAGTNITIKWKFSETLQGLATSVFLLPQQNSGCSFSLSPGMKKTCGREPSLIYRWLVMEWKNKSLSL